MKVALRHLGAMFILASALCGAQTSPPADPSAGQAASPGASNSSAARPLPDIPTLMHEVEAHQKASEALVKDYIYHSFATEQTLDGKDGVKKTETEDGDVFYVSGVRIRRLLKKNGRDLTPDEQKKESERIDKEIAKAKEKRGKQDESERDVVTVSRFLELGSFKNARRLVMDGRDTIAVDFVGDPKAQTHTRFEGALREMEGTVWVDEQDRSLRKVQGHFVHAFKVGGGMLADVKQGSSFGADWKKVNGEVWLPVLVEGQGAIRVLLLLNFHGTLRVVNSDFRKFKATSTILPVTGTPDPEVQTPPVTVPETPK